MKFSIAISDTRLNVQFTNTKEKTYVYSKSVGKKVEMIVPTGTKCTITNADDTYVFSAASSACNVKDQFMYEKGRKLALKRALANLKHRISVSLSSKPNQKEAANVISDMPDDFKSFLDPDRRWSKTVWVAYFTSKIVNSEKVFDAIFCETTKEKIEDILREVFVASTTAKKCRSIRNVYMALSQLNDFIEASFPEGFFINHAKFTSAVPPNSAAAKALNEAAKNPANDTEIAATVKTGFNSMIDAGESFVTGNVVPLFASGVTTTKEALSKIGSVFKTSEKEN